MLNHHVQSIMPNHVYLMLLVIAKKQNMRAAFSYLLIRWSDNALGKRCPLQRQLSQRHLLIAAAFSV